MKNYANHIKPTMYDVFYESFYKLWDDVRDDESSRNKFLYIKQKMRDEVTPQKLRATLGQPPQNE